MDKPKCRLCNERHYSYEEHVWPKVDVPNTVPNVPNKVLSKTPQRVSKWKKEHPEEYRKYMRELMRKRRDSSGKSKSDN